MSKMKNPGGKKLDELSKKIRTLLDDNMYIYGKRQGKPLY